MRVPSVSNCSSKDFAYEDVVQYSKKTHPSDACLCIHFFFLRDESNSGTNEFWAPGLSVEKGDGEALLLLSDPTLYLNYVGPLPTHPDFYNILVSEDLETFTLYTRVDYRETMVKVENLENDKPYYFKIAAEKGQETHDSNIVMTIPSQQLPMNQYLSGEYTIETCLHHMTGITFLS